MTTDGDRCQYETCRDVQRSNGVSRDDLSRLLRRAIVDCSSDNRRRKQGDAPGAEYCELCNQACKLHALCLVRPEHMMEGSGCVSPNGDESVKRWRDGRLRGLLVTRPLTVEDDAFAAELRGRDRSDHSDAGLKQRLVLLRESES